MATSFAKRLVCLCIFLTSSLLASTIHVPVDQPTIQQAINAAVSGDTVLVSPGVYTENIDFHGKAITVQSSSGANATIVDGGQKGSVVTFQTNEKATSVLNGFTIRNGGGTYPGAGIYIYSASPTITNNIIVMNNSCGGYGTSIQSLVGSPTIRGNFISSNAQSQTCGGSYATAAFSQGSSLKVTGNLIAGNLTGGVYVSDFQGGAVLVANNVIINNRGPGFQLQNQFTPPSTTTLVQNLIAGNYAFGVTWDNPPIVLVNNTIANNTNNTGYNEAEVSAWIMNNQVTMENNLIVGLSTGNTLYCNSYDSSNPPVFTNNDIFSSNWLAYVGTCPDLTGTSGNISSDPLFAALLSDNYHLTLGSPAIDVGSNSAPSLPTKDFDGDARIINQIVDIGVDEFSTKTTLTLSPSTLRFASQQQGTTSTAQTLTLTNHSGAAVAINLVATGSDFAQTNTCPASLAAGAHCTISIKFTPPDGGVKESALAVFTNATANPIFATLSGKGLAPVFGMSPSYIYFPNTIIGSSSTQTATITNSGQAPLAITSIVSTANTDFVPTSNCPAQLAVAASCTLTVTWKPSAISYAQGSVVITHNAPGSPSTLFTYGRSFSAGIATLSASSLSFPLTLVGKSSAAQNVTLTNTGTGNLGNITVGGGYYDFTGTTNCPTLLVAGASCTVSITYTPSTSGSETGWVNVYNDSPTAPQLSVSGSGQAPVPTISSISTTSAPAGSADLQLTITGTGFFNQSQVLWKGMTLYAYYVTSTQINFNLPASELTAAGLAQVTVVNPAPGGASNPVTFTIYTPVNYLYKAVPYVYQSISGTNLNLSYYNSVIVNSPFAIQFGGGSYTSLTVGSGGTISFSGYANNYNSPIPVYLVDTLIAPFWTSLFSWGTGTNNNVFWAVVGTAPNRQLVIEWRNVGICCSGNTSQTVKFETIFYEGSGNVRFNYADTVFGGTDAANDNGATATVGVQVSPALSNQFSYDTPSLKSLSSLLWYPSLPSVGLSTSTLNFGYHQIGNVSNQQKLTLTNGSLDLLQINSIAINNTDFTQTNNCGTSLAAGSSCTILVTFDPSQPVAESAMLTISDNAVNSPQVVTLNGTGAIEPIVIFPIQVNFGSVSVGKSLSLPVTLANASNQPLTIQSIAASPTAYTQSNSCGTSLVVGASCTITVTFSPTSTGAINGSLSMGLNGKPVSVPVTMTGTGF